MNGQGKRETVRVILSVTLSSSGSGNEWERKKCKKGIKERENTNMQKRYLTHHPSLPCWLCLLKHILIWIIFPPATSLPRPGMHHMEPSHPLRPCAQPLSGHQTELRATGAANSRWHELMRTGMGYRRVGVWGGGTITNFPPVQIKPNPFHFSPITVCSFSVPLNHRGKRSVSHLTWAN